MFSLLELGMLQTNNKKRRSHRRDTIVNVYRIFCEIFKQNRIKALKTIST